MKTKLCKKCGVVKPLDEFSRSKTTKDGRYSLCKKCKRAYKKEHKARDPERARAQQKEYRKRYEARHPDRMKAQRIKDDEKRRARDACDPQKIKARQIREAKRQDRALHPEKYAALKREKRRIWWAENREKIIAQRRDRYANDPEFRAKEKERDKNRQPEAYRKRRARDPVGFRAKKREYEAKNRERINAQKRLYRARDPEKYRNISRKCRQRKKAMKLRLILPDVLDILRDELTKGSDHEEKLEKVRAKREAHQAKERKRNKAYYAKNSEKIRATARANYAENRDKNLAKAQANRDKEPEKFRAYERKYHHKKTGVMTKFMRVIAEILLTINLLKGIEDGYGKSNQKKRLG